MKKLLVFLVTISGSLFLSGCGSTDSTTNYQVSISASPSEGGTVSPSSGQYEEGTSLDISATPAEEYRFVEWQGDYQGTNSSATITVDSDKNIKGVFAKKEYALTVNTDGKGTVEEAVVQAKSTDYDFGTIVKLTASPAEGWKFVEWTGDVTGTENPAQITVDEAKEVTAVFEKPFYLHENGVTIMCPNANVGDTGTFFGVIYTKRTRDQITTENAATTCTSGISDMAFMFWNARFFNGDLSRWDVSSVTGMGGMFRTARAFNGDLSSWDVSSVTNTAFMFGDARAFNGDIGSWDVSSVTDMRGMFWNARAFNGDLRSWDVSSVTDMRGMFEDADSFNGDISSWDVSSVTDMNRMFESARSFNGDISSWDVSSVTDMNRMFWNADSFNGDISSWDVSAVRYIWGMFWGADSFNGDLSGWCVSNISSEPSIFSASSPLTEENKPLWGTCPGTPSQIILTSPANSATAVSLTPTFSWEEDADATSYQLQVFEGSDPLVIDITTGSTSFTVSESRKGDVTYNWRVRGINENKDRTGEWSEIWSFTTE